MRNIDYGYMYANRHTCSFEIKRFARREFQTPVLKRVQSILVRDFVLVDKYILVCMSLLVVILK